MSFEILASGMVTPVGYQAASSCAAIRVGLDGFGETAFFFDGAPLRAASVPMLDDCRGREQLLQMAVSALDEAMAAAPSREHGDVALAVCLPEERRAGRYEGLDAQFASELVARCVSASRFKSIAIFPYGAIAGARAMQWADGEILQRSSKLVAVVGTDSFLHGPTLSAYHAKRRLVTPNNADGFPPGEAAAAVLLGPVGTREGALQCLGMGWGQEPALQDSGRPLRADGLVQAYRAALLASSCGYEHLDYRITDASGDQYAFKETTLALTRTMRVRKSFFDLWHPADCVGRVGAATAPLLLGVALAASQRRYAPGPGVLCHVTDDDGTRAAFVLREHGRASNPSMA